MLHSIYVIPLRFQPSRFFRPFFENAQSEGGCHAGKPLTSSSLSSSGGYSMTPPKRKVRTLDDLRPLVREGRYRIGSHASKHAICEGFTEQDIVMGILYGKELLRYMQDERLLALGYIRPSPAARIPLHVVLEYAKPRWVDVVTAFIPEEAHRVISRARLAQMLRHDQHEPRVQLIGAGVQTQ